MKNLFFWNKWNMVYKVVYLVLLTVFAASILFFAASYFFGLSSVIEWERNSVIEPMMVTVDKFTRNLFEYVIDVESYIIREHFHASEVKINLVSSYAFLGFLSIVFVTGLTIASFMKGFSFYAGIAIFMLWIVTSNIELINLFGRDDKLPAAAFILLFGGTCYYFNAFKTDISFLKRLIVFSFLFLGSVILLGIGTDVKSVALYISNLGITVPIILSILFIVINGFEIINGLLFISAGNPGAENKNRLLNFTIISLLYLGNVILLLMKKMLFIDWDILYLNPFLLNLLATVLGIWGYKKRSVLFKEFIPFYPFGAYYFLILGIVSYATMAYAFLTANDPLVECFEYAIIYTHVCFGILLFLYILINFATLFNKRLSIHEVVYRPLNLPFFMVRGLGGVAILALFMYSNNFAYYLGLAGYYNLGGDVYRYEENIPMAKQYYISGIQNEFQNHRSNYSMATISEAEKNNDAQLKYYSQTLVKYPLEFTYANLGNLYNREGLLLQSMFILKDGIDKFPKSGYLSNNLGLNYNKTNLLDSTYYYLNLANSQLTKSGVPSLNFLYLFNKKGFYEEADSLIKEKDFEKDMSFQVNKILTTNILNQPYQNNSLKVKTTEPLLPISFSYVFNKGINKIKAADASQRISFVDSLLNKEENERFSEALSLLKILNLYYGNHKKEAFLLLDAIINTTSNANYLNKLSALWRLEQRDYNSSAQYFERTIQSGGEAALLNYCMASVENGTTGLIKGYLNTLADSGNPSVAPVATLLRNILSANSIADLTNWEEAQILQFLHLRKNDIAEEFILDIFKLFKNEYYKTLAAIEITEYYLQKNEISKSEMILREVTINDTLQTFENGRLNYWRMEILLRNQDWKTLESLNSKIYLSGGYENRRSFFLARTFESSGNMDEAEKNYLKLIEAAPFFDQGIIGVIDFYNTVKKPMEAYNIAADAVQFNPGSAKLLMKYSIQALELNLTSYAESALESLSEILDEKELKAFKEVYHKKEQELEQGQ